MASATAAFFDLDGTLITGHMYSQILKQRMNTPMGAWRAMTYLVSHLAQAPLDKARLINRTRFFRSWVVDAAGLLKGLEVDKSGSLFTTIAEGLLATIRPDVQQLLRQHQEQGHAVVLVSGTFLPLLKEIGGRLHISHVVGTPLAERNGRYTGRLAGPFVFGEEKARQTQLYLQANGLQIDLAASYTYADRIHDLPLLQLVGHPVATYPDVELLAHARQQGWRVVGEAHA